MNLKTAVKLVSLLTALTATIVAIFLLKQGHLSSALTSMGFQKPGTRLNWCKERVASLHIYDTPLTLVEKQGQWMWDGEPPHELDYLTVEKWFARYCQIPVEAPIEGAKGETSKPMQAFMEVVFVDGQRTTLHWDQDKHFKIGKNEFISETLRQGLKELMTYGDNIGYQ